jgi:hypothetical protein
MNYTDNTKGFRRRNVIVKLDVLLEDILWHIEHLEEELMYQDMYEGFEYEHLEEELKFWQESYSFIRTLYCMLSRGNGIKKFDLQECNDIRKMLHSVTI